MATKTLRKKSDEEMLILVQKYFPSILSAKWTAEGDLIIETEGDPKPEELDDLQELVTGPKAWEWI